MDHNIEVKGMDERKIYSTITEAWNHDLPPIEFSVRKLESMIQTVKFPQRDYYLTMSSDPGSDVKFIVKSYKEKEASLDVLDNLIHRAFSANKHIPLRLGDSVSVNLAGETRIAREFTTSRGSTKRRWCASLVPSPDGSPFGLFVIFGEHIGIKDVKNDRVLDNPVHSALAASFSLSGPEVAR